MTQNVSETLQFTLGGLPLSELTIYESSGQIPDYREPELDKNWIKSVISRCNNVIVEAKFAQHVENMELWRAILFDYEDVVKIAIPEVLQLVIVGGYLRGMRMPRTMLQIGATNLTLFHKILAQIFDSNSLGASRNVVRDVVSSSKNVAINRVVWTELSAMLSNYKIQFLPVILKGHRKYGKIMASLLGEVLRRFATMEHNFYNVGFDLEAMAYRGFIRVAHRQKICLRKNAPPETFTEFYFLNYLEKEYAKTVLETCIRSRNINSEYFDKEFIPAKYEDIILWADCLAKLCNCSTTYVLSFIPGNFVDLRLENDGLEIPQIEELPTWDNLQLV